MHNRMRLAMTAGLFSVLTVASVLGQNSKNELMRQMQEADKSAPRVADTAPLFKLKSMDGKSETELGELCKTKPVVLIFGSYT